MGIFDLNFKKNYIKKYHEHLRYGEFDEAYRLFIREIEVTNYQYALHFACHYKNFDLVESILNERPNSINNIDSNNKNALHYAVNQFFIGGHTLESIFEKKLLPTYLLEGIPHETHLCDRAGNDSTLAKENKNKTQIISLLINKGININQEDNFNFTPLYFSIAARDEITAKKLIALGADVSHTSTWDDEEGTKKGVLTIFNEAYKIPWAYSSTNLSIQKSKTNSFKEYLIQKGADEGVIKRRDLEN